MDAYQIAKQVAENGVIPDIISFDSFLYAVDIDALQRDTGLSDNNTQTYLYVVYRHWKDQGHEILPYLDIDFIAKTLDLEE